MPSESRCLLLDTNVWLDYYLGFRKGHEAAYHLVEAAVEKDIELLYAATSSKDLFFLIASDCKINYRAQNGGTLSESAAKAAGDTAWACLEHLCELATPVACDQSDIWFARKQRALHADYEDDLVVAAAARAKANLLVTNDKKLIRHSPVATLSVRDALMYLG